MKRTAQEWIATLGLQPHVEGGYYRQILKADENVRNAKGELRALYTSIYFLLEDTNPSHFHRLQSDEVWYFHAGDSLTIHLILPDGEYKTILLGTDLQNGAQLQAVVPKGAIFGSSIEDGEYALVSCMVLPGFEYADFELFERNALLAQYPAHADIIRKLTRATQ
ncbi:cupin domain-containing protein [Aerococcaceae bacterium NML210727]|nr:cupin domain-containing protein [Aerococcaceae bacterium NML210727]MCW6655434.1 cupin domain-containing protein [Aerococcaceae bacterium NML201296]